MDKLKLINKEPEDDAEVPKKRINSKKKELIQKSRESALAAIQTFNTPLITFKSESFIVLMIIAWTYIMHAHFQEKKIDYRYHERQKKCKRTRNGAVKYWELSTCIKKCASLNQAIKDNLNFLIGIRNEIEHQMTKNIDNAISAKFQACCINYNAKIK